MTLPLIPKPGVGTSNWHTPMWAVIDRVNELAEIIRDTAGAAFLAGSGISITPNDAGDSIIVSATGGGGAGLTAEEIRDIVSALIQPGDNITVVVNDPGDIVTISAIGGGGLANIITPADHGLVSWSNDPANGNASTAPTAGVLCLVQVRVSGPGTISGVALQVATAGTGLSNCYVALHDASGARLAVSSDQSTSWQSGGAKSINFSTPATVPQAGLYYVSILVGAATAAPAFARVSSATVQNLNQAVGALRTATTGTGLTAIPASITMSGVTAGTAGYVVGLIGSIPSAGAAGTGTQIHAVGNSGTALTLDAASASGYIKTITLTGNCTFTLTGAVAGQVATLELVLTQDATGGRTITWPASVKWSGGAPLLSTAAAAVDRIVLTSYNGGTTWYGDLVGKGYA